MKRLGSFIFLLALTVASSTSTFVGDAVAQPIDMGRSFDQGPRDSALEFDVSEPAPTSSALGIIPPDFTVAFIGDQGAGSNAVAVLRLIKAEGTDMVLHQGDFDYKNDPTLWDNMITNELGADFPYFASIGNHDEAEWSGPSGYQAKLEARLSRIDGAQCSGDLGVNSACTYQGLFFILSGVGTLGSGHDAYIQEQLAQTDAMWRVCSWHKNHSTMQVGGKGDSVSLDTYDLCRKGGAFIATGHEHSYSRTYLMSSFPNHTIANKSSTLELTEGANGTTFAFVSGLGGASIRDQERNDEWWASVYTSTQGANYGALFCTFNVNGQPDRANCYFKDIDGKIADQFELVSKLAPQTTTFADVPASHPYYNEIEALYQAGYTAGCGTNPLRYCPDRAMNRAESAVFVERGIHGVNVAPPPPASARFADLSLSSWAAKWAEALYLDGYTAGCGLNPLIYCPWQGHTRAEAAVFYLRMLHQDPGYQPPAFQGLFSDVPATAWYARWAEEAYRAGLIPACGQDPLRYCPDGPLTRGLAAYMMVQAKGLQ